MLTVSFAISRDEMSIASYEDFDAGLVINHGLLDNQYTCKSPFIIRKNLLVFEFQINDDYRYDKVYASNYELIERATGKILGQTEVFNNEDTFEQDEDYKKNILKVAEKYNINKFKVIKKVK